MPQLEHLRSVFALFDTDNSGTIGHAEIKNLHTRLGESITDAEVGTPTRVLGAHVPCASFTSCVGGVCPVVCLAGAHSACSHARC